MYVFGGRGDEAAPIHTEHEIYCDKVYYLDITTRKWTCPPVSGTKPCGRRSHSACKIKLVLITECVRSLYLLTLILVEYKGNLYIFGGFNKILNTHFQDIYQYDPKSSTWKIIISKGTPPCARRRQICLVINDKVFISGGTSPISTRREGFKIENFNIDQILSNLRDHDDLHVLDLSKIFETFAIIISLFISIINVIIIVFRS